MMAKGKGKAQAVFCLPLPAYSMFQFDVDEEELREVFKLPSHWSLQSGKHEWMMAKGKGKGLQHPVNFWNRFEESSAHTEKLMVDCVLPSGVTQERMKRISPRRRSFWLQS